MTNNLAGKRVLVVEDEYLIAADLERALGKAGAKVVGPVADLETGMRLAGSEPLDAAVLDVNLKEGHSYPIAEALMGRTIPFLFMTGYDDWALPEAYRATPRAAKPCPVERITAMVERLVTPS